MSNALDDVTLCRVLAGVDTLSDRFVASIMKQAREAHGEERVAGVAQTYAAGGVEGLQKDAELMRTAQDILFALYMGAFPAEEGGALSAPASAEDYFESAVWRVIQAHPPALTGGYFGHWHYPPEDTND